ncbi:Shedu anti-phage system protein SduA domain-containing protein [Amycolatopsis sp. NPDC054798]
MTLKNLLLALHEHASGDEVARPVMDVLDHLGPRSPYKGGRQLLELVEFALRAAREHGDEPTVEGLNDALGYATGTVLEDDLCVKYPLYSGTGQDDLQMLNRTFSALKGLTATEVAGYLEKNPGASGEEVKNYFAEQSGRALRFVRARRAGHYGAYRIRTDGPAWLVDVLADRVDYVRPLDSENDSLDGLGELPGAEELLTAIQVGRRRAQLAEITRVVENRYSSEEHIRKALSNSWWIFGGKYVGELAQRRLMLGMEADIPLLRPDGVLHVVELKKANVKIVKRHRNRWIPTSAVHDAVLQAAHYLQELDESRSEIADAFGVETRRAFATVVIGHPKFQPDADARQIGEALRTYASHLSRIDIVTYAELVDSAERSLNFGATARESCGEG